MVRLIREIKIIINLNLIKKDKDNFVAFLVCHGFENLD